MSGYVSEVSALLRAHEPPLDDVARVELIRELEELKAVAAALQARVTAEFAASRQAQQRAAGVPTSKVGTGVASEVALARRISPYQAQRYVGWASVLVAELPGALAALERGETSEWRAMIVARETIWLSRADRARVDAELAPRLGVLGDRGVEAEAKKVAYRLDPSGFVARSRAAESERRVSLRPAPDAMARLTALLPVAQGVAAFAALRREADRCVGVGDARSHGQLMADTLVERVTGQATASAVPVEVELVMTDEALLGASDEPATLVGHGPIPAPLAREIVLRGDAPRWLRRLYVSPESDQLVALESRRRLFTEPQRRYLRLRDHGTCRTPYCDAAIRHYDHVSAYSAGGATDVRNGRGACQTCNYAKEAPGWRSRARPDGTIVLTTPTGHHYADAPTRLPGRRRSHVFDWVLSVPRAA